MRREPLPPTRVIEALERFGPQARPYNFDDMFDCWGLVRRVVDWLDHGDELNHELGTGPTAAEAENWAPIDGRDQLLPGDILASHPHAARDFHVVVYCGRVGGTDLVYDSSPRGDVPLFDGAGRMTRCRPLFTRYMRATETTDRMRHDGGGWLRLYDERMRFMHRGWHERLSAANPGRERELVETRRAAGLSDLPFYCTGALERDARGREVYDNRDTRHLDYYTPDGGKPGQLAAPRIVGVPHRILREGEWVVRWDPGPGEAVDAWRVELWEETVDLWKHRLLRADLDTGQRAWAVPPDLLREDARFAVVLWARGRGGFSGNALATVLWRPRPGNGLLLYNADRPQDLWPDGLAVVQPEASGLELTWSIADPAFTQLAARVRVFEGACLADDAEPVFEAFLEGEAASRCRTTVTAGALRPGRTYAWYVEVRDALGRWCYAPSEGLFLLEDHE